MGKRIDIELTGLIGSNPLGVLAAFGLLRVCHEIALLADAKLAWRYQDDWIAILQVDYPIDQAGLVNLLNEFFQRQTADVFGWADDVRILPSDYRPILLEAVAKNNLGDRKFCDYLAALASEIAVDNTPKALIKPTALYMTSGQQSFLRSAKQIIENFTKDSSDRLWEALFGPWMYHDKHHSLGWDPATERIYALRHKKPGDELPSSVSAAIRLSLEAIPLFPVFPDQNNRLKTTGFYRINREQIFFWPIWQSPIGLDSLKTLLCSSFEAKEANTTILMQRGISAVYGSVRSEFLQGYGIFRPARLVWQKS